MNEAAVFLQCVFLSSFNSLLPAQIIKHIMTYLHPSDLRVASLTCVSWFCASQFREFLPSFGIEILETTLNDQHDAITTLKNALRCYSSIRLEYVDFDDIHPDFWRHNADSMHSVCIEHSDIKERSLKHMLLGLRRVKHLTLTGCGDLFLCGIFIDVPAAEAAAIRQACEHIEHLGLCESQYVSDAQFGRLAALMPRLRSLDFTRSTISTHMGLYHKFYPRGDEDEDVDVAAAGRTSAAASESVFTFQYIGRYLKSSAAANIRHLNFLNSGISNKDLAAVCIASRLPLETLQLAENRMLKETDLMEAFRHQTQMRDLDISRMEHISDRVLATIASWMPELRVLRMHFSLKITDDGVRQLAQLRKLRVLDISECALLTGQALMAGIAAERNEHLEELNIAQLNLCQQSIMQTVEMMPELRLLDVHDCETGVTDLTVQWICRFARKLRVLQLAHCKQITDASLTGSGMARAIAKYEASRRPAAEAEEEAEDAVAAVYNDADDVHRHPYQISLRSKAEQDIVNDAKRKKNMLAALEEPTLEADNQSPYSIDSLRGLRDLNMRGCSRITDVCLRYSLHLPELRRLCLARCHQITSVGIAQLVRNAPGLEHVDLSECHSVDDQAIKHLAIGLRRMTQLQLKCCTLLTDHALDHLLVNCRRLSRLDVRGCTGLGAEPADRMAQLRSMRRCQQSAHGSYSSAGVRPPKRSPPAPPPAPPRGTNFFDNIPMLRVPQNGNR